MAVMLQAAAAFGGGIMAKKSLDAVQLPQIKYNQGVPAFKLSVRVLAASVPGLAAPGVVSQQRPFLEAILNGTSKETEFADYDKEAAAGKSDACASECPWRFGDTLTFKARLEDVLGPGLRLRLRVRKEMGLGPLHVEMRASDVGVAAVDLQRRVLPACVQERHDAATQAGRWVSPVLLVPLSHVSHGECGADTPLGEAVGHVALVCSLDTDPEPLMAAVLARTRPLHKLEAAAQKMGEHLGGIVRWLEEPLDNKPGNSCSPNRVAKVDAEEVMVPENEFRSPLLREKPGTPPKSGSEALQLGPDLAPDGWVSCQGPGGRTFWHHLALGPVPWQDLSAVRQDLPARQEHQEPPYSGDDDDMPIYGWSPEVFKQESPDRPGPVVQTPNKATPPSTSRTPDKASPPADNSFLLCLDRASAASSTAQSSKRQNHYSRRGRSSCPMSIGSQSRHANECAERRRQPAERASSEAPPPSLGRHHHGSSSVAPPPPAQGWRAVPDAAPAPLSSQCSSAPSRRPAETPQRLRPPQQQQPAGVAGGYGDQGIASGPERLLSGGVLLNGGPALQRGPQLGASAVLPQAWGPPMMASPPGSLQLAPGALRQHAWGAPPVQPYAYAVRAT